MPESYTSSEKKSEKFSYYSSWFSRNDCEAFGTYVFACNDYKVIVL